MVGKDLERQNAYLTLERTNIFPGAFRMDFGRVVVEWLLECYRRRMATLLCIDSFISFSYLKPTYSTTPPPFLSVLAWASLQVLRVGSEVETWLKLHPGIGKENDGE